MKLALFILLLVFIPGCSKNGRQEVSSNDGTVIDFRGKQLVLRQPAKSIVCLLESALSGLYMLGAEQSVIGVSTSVYQEPVRSSYAVLDHRLAAKEIAAPGNWDFVNLESIIALQPDLVIIWADQRDAIEILEDHHIPVYAVMLKSFSDVYKEVKDLGILTGTSVRADSLIRFAQNEMDDLKQRSEQATTRPAVYFMWPQGPLETSGNRSTVQE